MRNANVNNVSLCLLRNLTRLDSPNQEANEDLEARCFLTVPGRPIQHLYGIGELLLNTVKTLNLFRRGILLMWRRRIAHGAYRPGTTGGGSGPSPAATRTINFIGSNTMPVTR